MSSGALGDTRLGALAPAGGVLEGGRDALVQSPTTAGMHEPREAVLQSAEGPLADFNGPLLTPAEPGAAGDPKAVLTALTDPDHLKDAPLEGAMRAPGCRSR